MPGGIKPLARKKLLCYNHTEEKHMKTEIFTIGKIASAHSIRGEVKLIPYTDDIENLCLAPYVLLEGEQVEIEAARLHKNSVLLKLKGIDDRNAAEALKNKELCLPRELASPLQEGEYYVSDLLGLKLIDEKNHRTGTLTDVIPMAGKDVFTFQLESGETLMVVSLEDYIETIDIEKGEIVMDTTMGVLSGGKKK